MYRVNVSLRTESTDGPKTDLAQIDELTGSVALFLMDHNAKRFSTNQLFNSGLVISAASVSMGSHGLKPSGPYDQTAVYHVDGITAVTYEKGLINYGEQRLVGFSVRLAAGSDKKQEVDELADLIIKIDPERLTK